MNEITPSELKCLLDAKEDVQVIDVREPYEAEICSIGGELIPMGNIMDNLDKLRKDAKLIVHCRSGMRSGTVVQALEDQHGFKSVFNLKGGILAWADEVDNSIKKY